MHLLVLASEVEGSVVDQTLHLLSNPAHWIFEGITDLAFGALLAIPGSRWLHRHDRKKHAL